MRELTAINLGPTPNVLPAANSLADGTMMDVQDGNLLLSMGASGDVVRELQDRLSQLGYLDPSRVTGSFDQTTYNAVWNLQASTGIGTDGIFGQQSLAALKGQEVQPRPGYSALVDTVAHSTLSEGDNGAAVADLQRLLTDAGFHVEVTGAFGETTRAAVEEANKAFGLGSEFNPFSRVGTADKELVAKLLDATDAASGANGPAIFEPEDKRTDAEKAQDEADAAAGNYGRQVTPEVGPNGALDWESIKGDRDAIADYYYSLPEIDRKAMQNQPDYLELINEGLTEIPPQIEQQVLNGVPVKSMSAIIREPDALKTDTGHAALLIEFEDGRKVVVESGGDHGGSSFQVVDFEEWRNRRTVHPATDPNVRTDLPQNADGNYLKSYSVYEFNGDPEEMQGALFAVLVEYNIGETRSDRPDFASTNYHISYNNCTSVVERILNAGGADVFAANENSAPDIPTSGRVNDVPLGPLTALFSLQQQLEFRTLTQSDEWSKPGRYVGPEFQENS